MKTLKIIFLLAILAQSAFAQISNFSVTYKDSGQVRVHWDNVYDSNIQAYIVERKEYGAKELFANPAKEMVFLARDNTGDTATWNLGAPENIPFTTGGFQGLVFYQKYDFMRVAYIPVNQSTHYIYWDSVGYVGDFEYRLIQETVDWDRTVCSDSLLLRYKTVIPYERINAVLPDSFIVLRELFFLSQPSDSYFDGLRIMKNAVIYENEVTGGTPPVKENLMRTTATEAFNRNSYYRIMQYDIEYAASETDYRQVGNLQAHTNATTLAQYIGWAQNQEPLLNVGLYGRVPITDLWAYGSPSTKPGIQAGNDLLQPLTDALDILCPSMYLYYDENQVSYASYAVEIIKEAKRIGKGKKIYPYISPQFHPAGNRYDGFATKTEFANVLRTIKNAGADGVVLWGGSKAMNDVAHTWDENAGWWQATKEFMRTFTSIDTVTVPLQFKLSNAYPNPFNPSTHFELSLPYACDVSLIIYNIIGQEITTLINTSMTTGKHIITFNASSLPSGIYLYTLTAGTFTSTGKMIFMK